MISERTVFVLGAGASMPYGFPSGQDLRHTICTRTLVSGDSRKILADMGFQAKAIDDCRDALAKSWASSIDMFIASRKEHADIAKAAISLVIAEHEVDDRLFFANPKDDWFRYLWRYLHDKPEQMALVSFVTFNYDRSLEHAFVNAFTHGKGAKDVLQDFLPRIVHVYGSLGEYPYAGHNGQHRRYGEPSTEENTALSARTINVISEKNSASAYPTAAQSLLGQAERIMFLGFGYDADNLRMLRFSKKDSCVQPSCHVSGTAMGMTPQERKWITRVGAECRRPFTLSDENVDCLMFLRQNVEVFAGS